MDKNELLKQKLEIEKQIKEIEQEEKQSERIAKQILNNTIQFPLRVEKKVSYSMGDCDINYVIYDAKNMYIANHWMEKEEMIEIFVKQINEMYEFLNN